MPTQTIDHIVPFSRVEPFQREAYRLSECNLQPLCNHHHGTIKQQIEDRHEVGDIREHWIRWLRDHTLTREAEAYLEKLGLCTQQQSRQ